MGVNIYLLARTLVTLSIGGIDGNAGSLRRFWKITEMDAERLKEQEAAERAAAVMPSPAVALFADVEEMKLETVRGRTVKAHLVIGWDEGRTSVTDMGWDYLPVLGYAVRDRKAGSFVLYEERDEALHRITRDRALQLRLIDEAGGFVGHGQPTIAECKSVRTYIEGYAEADCIFDNGLHEKILFSVRGGDLPKPSWLTGRKPMQVRHYPS